jgi:hypothetical protein
MSINQYFVSILEKNIRSKLTDCFVVPPRKDTFFYQIKLEIIVLNLDLLKTNYTFAFLKFILKILTLQV